MHFGPRFWWPVTLPRIGVFFVRRALVSDGTVLREGILTNCTFNRLGKGDLSVERDKFRDFKAEFGVYEVIFPPREARRLPKLCLKNRTPNRPGPAGGYLSESAIFEVFFGGQNAF